MKMAYEFATPYFLYPNTGSIATPLKTLKSVIPRFQTERHIFHPVENIKKSCNACFIHRRLRAYFNRRPQLFQQATKLPVRVLPSVHSSTWQRRTVVREKSPESQTPRSGLGHTPSRSPANFLILVSRKFNFSQSLHFPAQGTNFWTSRRHSSLLVPGADRGF